MEIVLLLFRFTHSIRFHQRIFRRIRVLRCACHLRCYRMGIPASQHPSFLPNFPSPTDRHLASRPLAELSSAEGGIEIYADRP